MTEPDAVETAVAESPVAKSHGEGRHVEDRHPEDRHPEDKAVEDKPRRGRSTSHLKLVPDTLELREYIREASERYATQLDKSRPFNKAALEAHARQAARPDSAA